MDGKTFDRLTKGLSSGATRRRILGGLSAIAAGLLTGRTQPVDARPVAHGCGHAGRACGVNNGTDYGACCGNEKLTCTTNVSGRCANTVGNTKCAAPLGTACQGHCECFGLTTECRKGRCTERPPERIVDGRGAA
jgi:hypothetical protein